MVTCHEGPDMYGDCGTEMRDAATGEVLVAIPGNGQDVGRCMVADIDPETPGMRKFWGIRTSGVSSIHVKGKCWQKEPPVINGEITGRIIWESGGAAL